MKKNEDVYFKKTKSSIIKSSSCQRLPKLDTIILFLNGYFHKEFKNYITKY